MTSWVVNNRVVLTVTEDGSIEDSSGKVLFFSVDRFVRDICEGNCCFICGISPDKTQFNNEHILPEWILRKYGLFLRSLELPNRTGFRYDQYTVPCCRKCNELMGTFFEEPLSGLINAGYSSVARFLSTNGDGSWLVLRWLSLIFIKTHLKDKDLRFHKDRRLPDAKISDLYSWTELHHIHCIARSFYTGVSIDPKVHGSLLVLPAKVEAHFEDFDYGDLSVARTVLLRLGDVAFLAVLNDSCAAWNITQHIWQKLTGALTPLQLRELAAHFAFVNLNLLDRPKYHSKTDSEGALTISAELPDKVRLREDKVVDFGTVMHGLCKEIISAIGNTDKNNMQQYVRQGRYSFLFDSQGRFIQNAVQAGSENKSHL